MEYINKTYKWHEFAKLNITMQKNICYKMYELNNNFKFEVDTKKHYIGLKYAYFDNKEVRNTLNKAMHELNYI